MCTILRYCFAKFSFLRFLLLSRVPFILVQPLACFSIRKLPTAKVQFCPILLFTLLLVILALLSFNIYVYNIFLWAFDGNAVNRDSLLVE